jgi:hypothetical protein
MLTVMIASAIENVRTPKKVKDAGKDERGEDGFPGDS